MIFHISCQCPVSQSRLQRRNWNYSLMVRGMYFPWPSPLHAFFLVSSQISVYSGMWDPHYCLLFCEEPKHCLLLSTQQMSSLFLVYWRTHTPRASFLFAYCSNCPKFSSYIKFKSASIESISIGPRYAHNRVIYQTPELIKHLETVVGPL